MNTPEDDIFQSGYVTGYADARERLSMPGIYRQLYYFSLISGLAGFAIGALVARMP